MPIPEIPFELWTDEALALRQQQLEEIRQRCLRRAQQAGHDFYDDLFHRQREFIKSHPQTALASEATEEAEAVMAVRFERKGILPYTVWDVSEDGARHRLNSNDMVIVVAVDETGVIVRSVIKGGIGSTRESVPALTALKWIRVPDDNPLAAKAIAQMARIVMGLQQVPQSKSRAGKAIGL